ncbi:MAG: hypothetical protein ACK5DE_02430 [Bacteroidota bacterium]
MNQIEKLASAMYLVKSAGMFAKEEDSNTSKILAAILGGAAGAVGGGALSHGLLKNTILRNLLKAEFAGIPLHIKKNLMKRHTEEAIRQNMGNLFGKLKQESENLATLPGLVAGGFGGALAGSALRNN